jgi:hypothetical protein
MRALDNWQRRRADRRARMIASARRRQMEQLLETGPHTLPATKQPGLRSTHASPGAKAGLIWVVVATLAAVVGLGSGGPFYGDAWDPVPLLVAASVTVLAGAESYRRLRESSAVLKLLAASVVVVFGASFVLGVQGQVTVQDRPQWRFSKTAEASELASAIRADLYVLQENQSLLSYPPEQARSMLAYYQSAAAQAEQIAARWNPATAPLELPVPGFVGVLEKVNSAADLQRQALAGYADFVRQPDARLGEQVQAMATAAEQNYLLAAQDLATVVTPLGIELTGSEA